MRFWNPMPPGGYTDLFWAIWVTAVALALLALTVPALDRLPPPTYDPSAVTQT